MLQSVLTYDEQKAAEAAFSGQPFNSDWTTDAWLVYSGILDAMSVRQMDSEFATSRSCGEAGSICDRIA